MQLEDIDWPAGEVVVRGKGPGRSGCRCLPMSARRWRATCAKAAPGPRAEPCSSGPSHLSWRCAGGGVTWIVYDACNRAGLPRVGAYRLRHSAATDMLRAGASLAEIAQVLRHRRARTTAIYAKVDHAALSPLARPWPGSVS